MGICMKKIVSMVLSLVFVVSVLCPPFSAENSDDFSSSGRVFSIRNDGWAFFNNNESYYLLPNPSTIHGDYFWSQIYRQVYGDTYLAAAKTDHGSFMSMYRPGLNGGACFGMSVSSLLLFLGKLDWNDYNTYGGKVFDTVNEYCERVDIRRNDISLRLAEDSAVAKLIFSYQLLALNSEVGKMDLNSSMPNPFADYFTGTDSDSIWFKKGASYGVNPNGNYIREVYETACSTKIPLLVTITYSNPLSGENVSHAIVLRTERRPEDMGDGWYRIYIYDPNRPWFPESYVQGTTYRYSHHYMNNTAEDSYIELNPTENKWRYSLYGGKVSEDPDFIGCNADGSIRYMREYDSVTGELICTYPEYLSLFDISGEDYPCVFDGKAHYWFGADPAIGDRQSQFIILGAADISLPDGTPLIHALPSGLQLSSNSDLSLLGDDTTVHGATVLPYSEFVFECYGDNDVSIADGNNVISFACDGRATVTVSMIENSVRIQCSEGGDVLVKITDLTPSDGYTAVYADGRLSLGDDVVLSLKNERFEMTGSVSETSALQVFSNNATVPAEQYISSFSSENTAVAFDDIRDIGLTSLQGTIVSVGKSTEPVFVRLLDGTYEIAKAEIVDDHYFFPAIAPGNYLLEISRKGFCTETYEITVSDDNVIQDCELHLIGDLNGDGEVNSADGTLFARYMAKWSVSLKNLSAADINGDGEIDSADSSLLFRYLAKWNVPYFN